MNVKKKLKDLQFKLVYNIKVVKEDQVSIIKYARAYIKQLEAKIETLLNDDRPVP